MTARSDNRLTPWQWQQQAQTCQTCGRRTVWTHGASCDYCTPATHPEGVPTMAHTIISDQQARDIAFAWHGGGGSALYALASTGAINTARAEHDLQDEIDAAMWATNSEQDVDDLHALAAYAKHHGTRPAPAHWTALPMS